MAEFRAGRYDAAAERFKMVRGTLMPDATAWLCLSLHRGRRISELETPCESAESRSVEAMNEISEARGEAAAARASKVEAAISAGHAVEARDELTRYRSLKRTNPVTVADFEQRVRKLEAKKHATALAARITEMIDAPTVNLTDLRDELKQYRHLAEASPTSAVR